MPDEFQCDKSSSLTSTILPIDNICETTAAGSSITHFGMLKQTVTH